MVGLAGDLDPTNPYDVILAVPASHYFEYDESDGRYTNRFYVDEGGGTVLGANSIMGHDVFFDVEAGRIGLAESSCDYEALVQPFIDSGHLAPVDNGDSSRQSGQATEGDDGSDAGDNEGIEATDDGGTTVGSDDGTSEEIDGGGPSDGADDGSPSDGDDDDDIESQVDHADVAHDSDERFCDRYPCQYLAIMCGMMVVSMIIVSLVLRRRRSGPRYSATTMSELELRVTSSVDDDEVDFSDSYRDMHAREIT